jgi:hypothetical protein
MERVCGTQGKEKNPQRILGRKPAVNRPLKIPRLSVEENIILKFILKSGIGEFSLKLYS